MQKNNQNFHSRLYFADGVVIKKSLLYEEEEPLDGAEDNARQMLQFIEYFQTTSFSQVTSETPKLFTDFVEGLRRSSEFSIRTIFQQVRGTPEEKYLMEALPLIGTASSFALLTNLTLSGSLDEYQMAKWQTSLAFVKHPTLEMIIAVKVKFYFKKSCPYLYFTVHRKPFF